MAFCLIIIEALMPGLLKALFYFFIAFFAAGVLIRYAENIQKRDKKRERDV
jgi:hypothetical protein